MKNVDLLHNDPIPHRLKSTIDRVKMMSRENVIYEKQSLWLSHGRKNPVNRKETHGEMNKVRVCRGDKVFRKYVPQQQMLQFYTASEGNKKMPNTQCQRVEWRGCELQDTRLLWSHFGGTHLLSPKDKDDLDMPPDTENFPGCSIKWK